MAGNISNAVKCLLRSKPIYILSPELLYIGNRNHTFFLNSRSLNPLFPQPALPYHSGVVNFHRSSLCYMVNTQKFSFLLNNQRISLLNNEIKHKLSHQSSKETNTSSDNAKIPTTSAVPVELSRKEKLKRAVKEYGSTVVIFHIAISLLSLGGFYLIVSSGVNVQSLFDQVGLSVSSSVATGASTFVMAYAVHKVFAPVRISITLASTPFIVRYLRRIGFLKPPKPSPPTNPPTTL